VQGKNIDLINTHSRAASWITSVVAKLTGVAYASTLKPGGIFIFQTPDTACSQMANDKCGWLALKPDEHLHLFNSDNLKILAEKTGFSEYTAFDAFEEADGNFCALMRK
jgi:hypothetical protein